MAIAWRKYRKSWGWLLLLSMLLAAGAGYYVYHYVPDMYQSTVSLYVLAGDVQGNPDYGQDIVSMVVQDARLLLENPELMEKAEQKLSPDVLDGMALRIEGIAGSHLIRIHAAGSNPGLCQRAATALGVVLMEELQTLSGLHSISMAERAMLPDQPLAHSLETCVGIVLVGAFILFSLLFFLFTSKRRTISAQSNRRVVGNVPILGYVSDFRKDLSFFLRKGRKEHWTLYQCIGRSIVEDVRALSIGLRGSRNASSSKAIVVASACADEGKSSLTALLGSELAIQGKRVLLLDMDCYSPVIGKLLGVTGKADLVDYFCGKVSLDDIILHTPQENLFLIDYCHEESFAAWMSGLPAFQVFMNSMLEEFDFVLLDTPPIFLFADAIAFGNMADQTLLVMADGRMECEKAEKLMEQLIKAGNRLAGIVLTFTKPRAEKQYRDYEDAGRKRKFAR